MRDLPSLYLTLSTCLPPACCCCCHSQAGGASSGDGKCTSSLDIPIEAYDQRTEVRAVVVVVLLLGCGRCVRGAAAIRRRAYSRLCRIQCDAQMLSYIPPR
jgi:hypothetical protein